MKRHKRREGGVEDVKPEKVKRLKPKRRPKKSTGKGALTKGMTKRPLRQLSFRPRPAPGSSWYSSRAGYFVAFCFFALAAYLIFSTFRRSDD
jgi:hypothetical protein